MESMDTLVHFTSKCERFFRAIVLSMVNTSFSLFSPYFREFLPGTQFWNFSFLLKYIQKILSWIWKFYLTSHPTKIDLEYIFLLLSAFWAYWLPSRSLLLPWLSLWLRIPLLLLHTDLLLWYVILTFLYQKLNFTSSQVSRFR